MLKIRQRQRVRVAGRVVLISTSILFWSLTQIPGGEGRRRRAAGLLSPGAEDGAVGLVVDQAGHEGSLLVLGQAGGVAARGAKAAVVVVVVVVVVAGGVAADWSLVPA